MLGEKWTVHWSEYASDTYLYGSQVMIHPNNDVDYSNRLMPPGTIIKKWYSMTNYQLQRIEPALPIIDGESQYQITVNIDYPDKGNCLVRLVFLDRYGEEADSITIRDKIAKFRCPLKTYSYQMQLINGGATKFCFHSIVIQEIVNEEEQ